MIECGLNSLLLAAETAAGSSPDWQAVCQCRTFWALLLGAIGLGLMLPRQVQYGKTLGGVLAIIAAGLMASDIPLLNDWTAQGLFWFLAAITLVSAFGTICSQSPVYAAIWFAMSLLGTAGLFFFNGAQFLGVATIVVYAGAIVVTFLFVIMLAQPEGHSAYDRISWGWLPKVLSVFAAATMVGLLTMLLGGMRDDALAANAATPSAATVAAAPAQPGEVLHKEHMAGLGRYLFSRHLISVEIAGTLLLAALVGAVAIVIQGKPRIETRIREALE